jgi:hypothetical protein
MKMAIQNKDFEARQSVFEWVSSSTPPTKAEWEAQFKTESSAKIAESNYPDLSKFHFLKVDQKDDYAGYYYWRQDASTYYPNGVPTETYRITVVVDFFHKTTTGWKLLSTSFDSVLADNTSPEELQKNTQLAQEELDKNPEFKLPPVRD